MAGETHNLMGQFIGETHRVLERTQIHPPGNQHQKGPICLWVVEDVTESLLRAQPAALFPLGPLPHIQCHSAATWVAPPWLPASAPPTSLDECFFFIFLVVKLPYSSIFCQFWLLFVFKLLLSFFWLCEEAQCVYLRLHLGQKSGTFTFLSKELIIVELKKEN